MRHCATRMRNTRKKRWCPSVEWIYVRFCVCACAAGPLHTPHTHSLAFGLVATRWCPSSHRLPKSNQSLFLWLLFRGVWPFCMWPFWDFSLASSPSSSDSVSSLSLRSSWTMSCQDKKGFAQGMFSGEGVEGQRAIKSGASYVAW